MSFAKPDRGGLTIKLTELNVSIFIGIEDLPFVEDFGVFFLDHDDSGDGYEQGAFLHSFFNESEITIDILGPKGWVAHWLSKMQEGVEEVLANIRERKNVAPGGPVGPIAVEASDSTTAKANIAIANYLLAEVTEGDDITLSVRGL
jgi:hypothetical protein